MIKRFVMINNSHFIVEFPRKRCILLCLKEPKSWGRFPLEPNLLNSNFYSWEWGGHKLWGPLAIKTARACCIPLVAACFRLKKKYWTLGPGVTGGGCVCPSVCCRSACVPFSCLDTLRFWCNSAASVLGLLEESLPVLIDSLIVNFGNNNG